MATAVRVNEEAHKTLTEMAEAMDTSVASVVDELLKSNGEIVGFCPEHGVPFTEDDVESRLVGKDVVRCPEKFQSCAGEERAHQELTGGGNRIPVGMLSDEPGEGDGDEEKDGSEEEDGAVEEEVDDE